ncbi:hypothetical protein ACIBD9_24830 [Micromonospora sp. NPDC050784]|uniref:hypothetical protein n=1 Tax=Micromonospora sp. NPDC050784 TaxID=3364281 RepID=UPI0037BA8888
MVFPQLAPLARTTTRLHPRPGSPSVRGSSVGGPLLWPVTEAWPFCDGPHQPDGRPATTVQDVRLLRQLMTAANNRPAGDMLFTPQEQQVVDRIDRGRPWPEEPVALLPVAQLYLRDVPHLRVPEQADMLQVLWCPFDHPEQQIPKTALFWRSSTRLTDVVASPPQPVAVQHEGYVPQPCLIHPEQVTEYPAPLQLEQGLREQVEQWSARQKAGAAPESAYDQAESAFYQYELSVAPGWKVGGWAPWSFTDPHPLPCQSCGTPLEPLLTIASSEWDDSNHSWIPYEDRDDATREVYPDPARPSLMSIAGFNLQLYVCPVSPEHPHAELLQ